MYLYEKMEGKAENMGDFIEERYDNDNNTNVKYDKKDFIKENTGK